jgi:MFS family permease
MTLCEKKQAPVFYGWVIVAISAATLMLATGVRHSFSVFFPSILDDFGWSRGSTSIILSLHLLVFGVFAPFAGNLADRWQPKRLMHIGVVVIGLATAGCSFAYKVWHFYLIFGLLTPIGMSFCNLPLLLPALSNWFHKRLGLAIGLSQVGGGLSFVYAVFAQWVISSFGWRIAYIVVGAMALLLLPIHFFFFFYRPGDKGMSPYGGDEKASLGENRTGFAATINASWILKEAIKTAHLWFLVVSLFFWGMSLYLILTHQIKLAVDVGYSSMFAASIFGLYGIFMITGQFASSASDRTGREAIVILATLLKILALVCLFMVRNTSSPVLLYIYAICMGFGAGLYIPTLFAGAADIFHGSSFGSINGIILSGMGIGGSIGPWIGGYVYDVFGNYDGAILFAIAGLAFSGLAFVNAAPRHAAKIRMRLS